MHQFLLIYPECCRRCCAC